MKKSVFGRKFKRDVDERKALFKNLVSSLILEERIETTEQKAKAIKADVEKLVTKAKKNTLKEGENITPKALKKMIESVAPRFKDRNGGYTRITRVGKRFGDDAFMVVLEWVEKAPVVLVNTEKGTAKKAAPEKKEVKKETPKKAAKPAPKKKEVKEKKK